MNVNRVTLLNLVTDFCESEKCGDDDPFTQINLSKVHHQSDNFICYAEYSARES